MSDKYQLNSPHHENEIMSCFDKYLCKERNVVHTFNDNTVAACIEKIFFEGTKHLGDSPDMYIVLDNIVLIIEHFEFDSYKNTKKGSKGRIEQAHIDKLFDKNMSIGNDATFSQCITEKTSYENHINNVKKAFMKHYNRIDDYIDNLTRNCIITPQSVVKTLFVIENTSPFGCVCLNEAKKITPVLLSIDKQFIDFLKDKERLDYILTFSNDWGNSNAYFIDCHDLNSNIKECIDYNELQYIDVPVHTIGGIISLPLNGNR